MFALFMLLFAFVITFISTQINKGYRVETVVKDLGSYGNGYAIIKNVFDENTVDELNEAVTAFVEEDHGRLSKKNIDHFATKNTRVWNFPERLAEYDPKVLLKLITNKHMNDIIDGFLGRFHVGSLAVNIVNPGSDEQSWHTDYPVGFSKTNCSEFSRFHMNHLYAYFSLQVGIALTDMNITNGVTQLVPRSHRIDNIDSKILKGNFVEHDIVTPTLKRGDVVFFNRRLVHRAGANTGASPRTMVLLQAVMPFGLGMERISNRVFQMLEFFCTNNTQTDCENLHQIKYRLYGEAFPMEMM